MLHLLACRLPALVSAAASFLDTVHWPPAPLPLTLSRAKQQGQQYSGEGDAYSSPDAAFTQRRPAGSKIQIKKRGPRLEIDIPPSGFKCARI